MNDFLTPAPAAVAVLILAFTLVLLMLSVIAKRAEPAEMHA
jgi:hypothetical protein